MFKTTYVIKIDSVFFKELIKNHIEIIKIKYKKNACFLYVDENNYKKIAHLKKIDYEIYRIFGKNRYKYLIKKYDVFLISLVLGIGLLYLLSNIIFDVKIMTNKSELVKIITSELDSFNLKKYRFVKSFNEKEEIKKYLLTNYKDKFEWLEIDRVGSKYYVRVLERIIRKDDKKEEYHDVVAKKNAIIKEIKASNGQVIKKINDYVNKGDVIISGKIMKNDEVKSVVNAKGTIYGETWYTVKVELPRTYSEEKLTGKEITRYCLNLFNKRFCLFGQGKFKNVQYEDNYLLESNILPISFTKTKIKERKSSDYFYTYDQAEIKGEALARKKLLENLSRNSEILLQKKLKLYEENSKIMIEVFFKVYEEITDYKKIILEGE